MMRSVRRRTAIGVAVGVFGVLQGCGGGGANASADRPGAGPDSASSQTTVAVTQTPLPPGSSVDPGPKARTGPVKMLFIGTSLTAGYGLADPNDAWPAEVGRIADSLGYKVSVQNAGLSGETSAGALRRADWVLKDPADVVVIETGANDGLRGLSLEALRANLTGIIGKVHAKLPGAEVVVVQMEAPPNMGGSYAKGFGAVFGEVAKAEGATLTPFLLDSVAGLPALNQADGIHPTEAGARKAARNVWPVLRGVLDRVTVVPPKV